MLGKNVFLSHKQIYHARFIIFIDPPEIEVEQPTVHSGIGHEAQLVCIVHGEPTPSVVWYQDTTQLGITEQFSQQVRFSKLHM